MVRVWARYSDRMRANPIIAFIVSDPRIKEGTLDHFGAGDTGGSGQCPTGRTFCVGLTLKRHCWKAAATARCFSSYFPRPNATLFVITRPLVHNAMSILVPDRWIFIVKAGRAFSYGRERACRLRLKSNIPRKIKSDGLLWKVLAY
jgi:hypothetical protein